MTSKVNQRVKRKNNFLDAKIEPNMKALKKEDIIAQFNALQANYDILQNKNIVLEKKIEALENENKTHIEAIYLLEETVKILEKQSTTEKQTKEIQTDTSELKYANTEVYLCGDCDYVADCIHDFNDHTHSLDSGEDMEDPENSHFSCHFCDKIFETLSEVMKHKKAVHTSSVRHCKQYLENVCFFGDSCWFLHSEAFRKSEPSFRCNFCEDRFRTQNDLREHMKQFHFQVVSKCKNGDECKFGHRKCWFIHQEDIEIEYNNAKNGIKINDNDKNCDMELNMETNQEI